MEWGELGHNVYWAHNPKELPVADFCFCLSFGQLLPNHERERFSHTLVVHESELPRGKGWSPLTWQILEGKNRIPVTLFEAAEQVDSGSIYAQRWIEFEGNELVGELRQGQASTTLELCRWFVDQYPNSANQAQKQQGEETYYTRRQAEDSVIDPDKSISDQFNLFRVVDNERYPALIYYNDTCYELKIARR